MSLIPQLLRQIYEPFKSTSAAVAPVDWKETAEAHVLKADLPGLKKGEVKVSVEDDGKILQISGAWPLEKEEEENKNEKWHRVERPHGEFQRRFYLPADAKTDEVKASMENGVLTITIPKQEIKKLEVKNIEIVTN